MHSMPETRWWWPETICIWWTDVVVGDWCLTKSASDKGLLEQQPDSACVCHTHYCLMAMDACIENCQMQSLIYMMKIPPVTVGIISVLDSHISKGRRTVRGRSYRICLYIVLWTTISLHERHIQSIYDTVSSHLTSLVQKSLSYSADCSWFENTLALMVLRNLPSYSSRPHTLVFALWPPTDFLVLAAIKFKCYAIIHAHAFALRADVHKCTHRIHTYTRIIYMR